MDLPEWLETLDPSIFLEDDYVVLDFETTNLDKGDADNEDNRILLAVWHRVKDGKITEKIRWGSEYELQELVDDINDAKFFVAHNALFETKWLDRCGLDTKEVLSFCTQVGEYVLSGNRKWPTSLKACASRRGWPGKMDVISYYLNRGICVSDLPKSWVEDYCRQDVVICHKLFLHQRYLLRKHGLLAVTMCRNLRTPVLADLESVGMTLDPERVKEEYDRLLQRKIELEEEFAAFTGGINVKSPQQMREFLYGTLKFAPPKDYKGNVLTTNKGEVATNANALARLKAKTKKQKRFLELRNDLTKTCDALSKYVKNMQKCCEETGGNLKGSYNTCVTSSHRLSCSGKTYGMQLQNIPRVYKRLFKARNEGWLVGENDYPQLEYRCAVDMSRDEAGLYDIEHGVDSHKFTASIVYKEEWEKNPTKELRTAAKAHTFKPLYGGNSGAPNEVAYYNAFKEKHKGITSWQEENKRTVLREGKLRIPSGLIFYWPDTRITQTGYITNSTVICNYPVQSFATADIVPLGLVFAWHRMKRSGLRSFIINTVHDSIIGEVHPDEVEQYNKIVASAMVDDVITALKKLYNYEWITPLDGEGEYYYNWADESSGTVN